MLKLYGLSLFGLLLHVSVQAGPWFKKSNFGGEARHRASAFSIGNHGYLGLGHINAAGNVDYEDFWKYDPASDSWTQIADFAAGKCFHATAFVIDNKAYVGTGRLADGTYTKKFYCYDPLYNTWTAIADFPGAARRGAVSFSVNGKGYVGTGQTGGGYSADFYEYNPLTNSWLPKAPFPGPPRTSSVAFTIDNFGYVGTGNTNSGSVNDFYRYDPATNQWIVRSTVGPTNRQEAAGFSVNGKGYIGTGDDFSSGNNFPDFWEYDPLLNTWVQIPDFDGTARRYLVGLTIGNRAYVGTGTNGTNFNDFWMFDKVLGLLQNQVEEIQPFVYPNPVQDVFRVDLVSIPNGADISGLRYKVIDLSGRIAKEGLLKGSVTEIRSSDFRSGYYILDLSYQGERFYTTKLFKE